MPIRTCQNKVPTQTQKNNKRTASPLTSQQRGTQSNRGNTTHKELKENNMVKVYKSIDDFKIDYPNLELLQNALTNVNGDYNLLVTTAIVPTNIEKIFTKMARLVPTEDTISFLRRNRKAGMDVLAPVIQNDVDSYEKSVGIEMLKLMGTMGNANLVFNEVPLPYIKFLVEVIKLSLPDTEYCYEPAASTDSDSQSELRDALAQDSTSQSEIPDLPEDVDFSSTPSKLPKEFQDDPDVDEDDFYIE